MPAKRAAVRPDVLERSLGDISASELITALDRAKLGQLEIAVLADKKKYELWVEEVAIDKIPLRDLLDRIRGEKKKLELEKRFGELDFDPRRMLEDPAVREVLVREIADEMERRAQR